MPIIKAAQIKKEGAPNGYTNNDQFIQFHSTNTQLRHSTCEKPRPTRFCKFCKKVIKRKVINTASHESRKSIIQNYALISAFKSKWTPGILWFWLSFLDYQQLEIRHIFPTLYVLSQWLNRIMGNHVKFWFLFDYKQSLLPTGQVWHRFNFL